MYWCTQIACLLVMYVKLIMHTTTCTEAAGLAVPNFLSDTVLLLSEISCAGPLSSCQK